MAYIPPTSSFNSRMNGYTTPKRYMVRTHSSVQQQQNVTEGENSLRNDYLPTAHVSPRSNSIQRSPSHREWVEPRLRQTNSVEDLLQRPAWENTSHKQNTHTGLKQWNSYTNIDHVDKEEFSAPNITLDQTQFADLDRPPVPCAPIQSNLSLPPRSYSSAALHSSQPSLYSHGRDLAGVRTVPHSHTTPPQMLIGMTQWQQSQPVPLSQNLFGGSSGLVDGGVSSSLTFTDPHKWDALHRAADSIVKEKDGVIEKLKQEILQLRNHVDLQRQREQITRAQEQSEMLNMQLQEYQYESAHLKVMLTEAVNSKTAEVDQANRKLGEVEYELRQLQLKTNRDTTSKQKEMTDVQRKLSSQEALIMDWKSKYGELKEDYGQMRQKMMGLEGYIADLPTSDEHSKKTNELKSLMEYKNVNEKRITELEKAVKARDSLIHSLEVTERNLSDEISKYKKQNDKLRQQLLGTDSGAIDSADPSLVNEELGQLRQDNLKLRSDIEKAKKIIEGKQRKLRHLEARMKAELAQKDEQINQDESVATMMREIRQKDEQIKTLHSTVKEVASQNQDMMEENMTLKSKVKDATDAVTGLAGEVHRLQLRLQNELVVCVGELQSLVQICVQRSQGQDPNISVLLGVRATGTQETSGKPSSPDIQSLASMIEKVRDLRADVDNLRELISNKYAEDMGDNLTCATQ